MLRRLVVLVGLVTALALGAGAPAALAASYPPSGDAVEIMSGSTDIRVGDTVAFAAHTFRSGSDVTFAISSPLAGLRGGTLVSLASGTCQTGTTCVAAADADGVATVAVHFTLAGRQTVTVTGTGADGTELTVSSTVTVAAAAAAAAPVGSNSPTGALPRTGADVAKWGLVGAGLVALGALLVVAVRRRSGPAGG